MQQVRDQVFDKKNSKACRKHVANPHELVENLAATLIENQVCTLQPGSQPGLQLASG